MNYWANQLETFNLLVALSLSLKGRCWSVLVFHMQIVLEHFFFFLEKGYQSGSEEGIPCSESHSYKRHGDAEGKQEQKH